MTFDTVTTVLIGIGFFVPGFILSAVLGTTFRRSARSAADLTLQYLTFSCFNHGFWSWLIVLMIQGNWLQRYPKSTSVLVMVVLFISPVFLGLTARWLARKEWVQRLLSSFGFMVQRFIPTSWDFKFQKEAPSWITVRLKDGSSVCGFFGNQSFAGDDPDERDLYIEAVFLPREDGKWWPVPDTGGIIIKASEIATIEFRRIQESTHGH